MKRVLYAGELSFIKGRIDHEGWYIPWGVYGEISEIEAEMRLREAASGVSLGLGIGYRGYYAAKLMPGENGGRYLAVVRRRDGVTMMLAQKALPAAEDWISLRFVRQDQAFSVYVADRCILSCVDTISSHARLGEAGVLFLDERTVQVRQLRILGMPATKEKEEKPALDPLVWRADFSKEAGLAYWQHSGGNWGLSAGNENNVYALENAVDYAETWLNAFDRDPTIRCTLRAVNPKAGAQFGLLLRASPETAYVRVGFDLDGGGWFIEDTCAQEDCPVQRVTAPFRGGLPLDGKMKLCLEARGNSLALAVDGRPALFFDGLLQGGIGCLGVFARNTALEIHDFVCHLSNGLPPIPGMISYTPPPDRMVASMEIEDLGQGRLLGITKDGLVLSQDWGASFALLPPNNPYQGADPEGFYQSVLKRTDGSFLQVRMNSLDVQTSPDMRTWKTVGNVMPEGKPDVLFHTSSLTEIDMPGGGKRIFCPLAFRRRTDARLGHAMGHYSKFYYSDDDGKTWRASRTDTRELLPAAPEVEEASTWAESKVIRCADGSLRAYYSRNRLGCMQYTVSWDQGETWGAMTPLPYMQCAGASYAIAEDPGQRGTYYMVWVNSSPLSLGSLMARTRLSLARSTNGKDWVFLADLERMPLCFSGRMPWRYPPLFQILDPSLTVTEKYLFISFGRSAWTDTDRPYYHHQQRVRLVRLEKERLHAFPWNAATVAELGFPASITLEKAPKKTRYGLGEALDLSGGTFLLTALDGSTRSAGTEALMAWPPPRMDCPGKQTIHLYQENGFCCEMEIEVEEQ